MENNKMKMYKYLDDMLQSDRKLYEQILDTTGFSYYFNQICELVRQTENENEVYRAELKLPRVVEPISPDLIESRGWKPTTMYENINKNVSYRHAFIKGNYMMVLDTRKPSITIAAKDVLKIDWMPEFPEQFRVHIPCYTMQQFDMITEDLLKANES